MKIRYYLMGAALVALASVSFTACSDDDDPVADGSETPELTLPQENPRVKIGTENRIPLPVQQGAGEYSAFSLNPDIADITYDEAGNAYIEGLKNGTAEIVVSDASGAYKRMLVSVYTTDVLTLSHTEYTFVTPMGISSTSNECAVDLGNGGYSIESDNDKVMAAIDEETGEIVLTATSAKDNFTAVVTVTDCTGLTATMNITVEATFDAFTDSDIATLAAKTANETYIKSNKFDQTCNTECASNQWYYGTFADDDNDDGTHTFGWWDKGYGDYGGHYIVYPQGTALNQDVVANYQFKYRYGSSYPVWDLEGTARIIRDDETAKVVIWWNVDMEAECISRGWIVVKK